MPDKTLEQLLDPDVLTERYVQQYNAENFPLTGMFWAGSPRQERADEFKWVHYSAISEPAPLNVRGGAARSLTPNGASERLSKCYTIFNESPVDADALTALRSPDSRELQAKGMDSVGRVFDEFTLRHQILRELIIAKSLVVGTVYIGEAGAVLESSSGALMSVDLGIPATNTGNLDGIIAALWSTSTAKIGDQLDAVCRRARKANVPPPTEIIVNEINKKHLRNNDQFVEWAVNSNQAVDTILRGEMIQGLWGYNWHFVGGTYTASDGTTKDFVPTTAAIIVPAPSSPIYHRTSHLTLVPNQIGLVGTWQESVARLDEKFGAYSYAEVVHNPAKLRIFMGDKFGFVFREPSAINIATAFTATT